MMARDLHQQPVLSAAKTLTRLLAVSSNRSCADCRSTLIDSSQIYASVSNCDYNNLLGNAEQQQHSRRLANLPRQAPCRHLRIDCDDNDSDSGTAVQIDPALLAAKRIGGHGVFLCSRCCAAHELLGTNIAVVHSIQDMAAWNQAELHQLIQSGGNARAWQVLEAFLPPSWEAKRPSPESSIGDRLVFIRAKYEALAFVLPPPGPMAQRAWAKIVSRHPEWKQLWGEDSETPADIDMGYGDMAGSHRASSLQAIINPASMDRELPDRLVDFFCVVSCSDSIDPLQAKIDLSDTKRPEDILLAPTVKDCYPQQDSHEGLEFPEHVSTFLFPEGCRGTTSPLPPSFFTFVLTTANGDRLYGGALVVYDDHRDINYFQDALRNTGYKGEIPTWMHHVDEPRSSKNTSGYSDVVFLPQCLVVLSHYPFYDIWRKFLLQLYRISLVEAPLPIERFIANFVREVPLPPPGKVQINFGFTVKETWTIERPPENELPLANFSFKPLFTFLSVSNVMVVFSCLLKEMRVALCCKSYSILGPVAEALTSLLFPFHWEGMYLPIMPYSLLDILDAPVPFLVGLHSRYLTEVEPEQRPKGVVFVDLDCDEVHLGFSDNGQGTGEIPWLPSRHATKLKAKLEEFASVVYVMPSSGNGDSVTVGNAQRLSVSQCPSYVGSSTESLVRTEGRRRELLTNVSRAYRENDLQEPLSGFLTEHGQITKQEMPPPSSIKRGTSTGKRPLRFLRRSWSHDFLDRLESSDLKIDDTDLLAVEEPEGFSARAIREAFLRFFVAVLQNYRMFMNDDGFHAAEFVQSLGFGPNSAAFCNAFVTTQLFDRFIEERRESQCDHEVRFFDESINAKVNRSKKNVLINFGHADVKDTAFLDDSSRGIEENYTPPPPSNWGLPDDGRRYAYSRFPKLERDLFGKVRPPRKWQTCRRSMARRGSVHKHQTGQAVYFQTMAPLITPRSIIRSATKCSAKSLENAIGSLSGMLDSVVSKSAEKRYSAPTTSALDRSLHSYLARSSMSAFAYSSPSSENFKLERNTDISSEAERVVINARRKQSILIGIIMTCQIRYKFLRGTLSLDSSNGITEPSKLFWVSELNRKQISAKDAACLIQSVYRGLLKLRMFRTRLVNVLRVQSLVRGRTIRFAFGLVRQSIIGLQAVARRFIARLRVMKLIDRRLEVYREHIFSLWVQDCTPLTYRTNFWFVIQFSGLIQHGMAESEVIRLWSILGINTGRAAGAPDGSAEEPIQLLGLSLGFSTTTHARIRALERSGALQDLKGDATKQSIASARENAERTQIYERLSAITSNQRLLGYFDRFAIGSKVKKKKQELAQVIWTKYELADESTSIILELFPEVKDTTNMIFAEVSKKGTRRFRSYNQVPEQLERPMWAHDFLSNRIHAHVREIADISLRILPTLSLTFVALDARNRFVLEKEARRKKAFLGTREAGSWQEYRLALIQKFLAAELTSRPIAKRRQQK